MRAAQAVRNPALLALLGLPAGAAAEAVRAALNKPNRDGNLPIHRALRDEATGPELVRAMLDAGGEAMLGVPGIANRLPLHYAAEFSSSPAVVALLLARGPAGALRAKMGVHPARLGRGGQQGPGRGGDHRAAPGRDAVSARGGAGRRVAPGGGADLDL